MVQFRWAQNIYFFFQFFFLSFVALSLICSALHLHNTLFLLLFNMQCAFSRQVFGIYFFLFTFIVDRLTRAHGATEWNCTIPLNVHMCMFQSTIKKQNERAHNLIGIIIKEKNNQFNETKLSTIEINISISSETVVWVLFSVSMQLLDYVLTMLKHANRFDWLRWHNEMLILLSIFSAFLI